MVHTVGMAVVSISVSLGLGCVAEAMPHGQVLVHTDACLPNTHSALRFQRKASDPAVQGLRVGRELAVECMKGARSCAEGIQVPGRNPGWCS